MNRHGGVLLRGYGGVIAILFLACGKHGAVNSQQLPRVVTASIQDASANTTEGGEPPPPASIEDASSDLLWGGSLLDSAIGAENHLCQANCATSADLPCADRVDPSVCFLKCIQVISPQSQCSQQMRAAIECIVATGPDVWTCLAGHTVLKQGYCYQEQLAFNNCVNQQP